MERPDFLKDSVPSPTYAADFNERMNQVAWELTERHEEQLVIGLSDNTEFGVFVAPGIGSVQIEGVNGYGVFESRQDIQMNLCISPRENKPHDWRWVCYRSIVFPDVYLGHAATDSKMLEYILMVNGAIRRPGTFAMIWDTPHVVWQTDSKFDELSVGRVQQEIQQHAEIYFAFRNHFLYARSLFRMGRHDPQDLFHKVFTPREA